MNDIDIGWHFPPTGGGRSDGYNDPGIAHFDGAHEASLARETLQNSLDARAEPNKPVEVEFEIKSLDGPHFHHAELAESVEACIAELGRQDDKAASALSEARRLLGQRQLTFLRISDRNTTGLRDERWRALVKMQGASVKDDFSAGGSHGIGKFAPFAVSPLRTVFYWTRFHDGAGRARELFQGRAVLMSHNPHGEEKQGTGFFGIRDGCREVADDQIPGEIRATEGSGGALLTAGTSLWIAGFQNQNGWQRKIARSVITSFFGAINDGSLAVTLEPSSDANEDEWQLEINGNTIKQWFGLLAENADEDADAVNQARVFWELIRVDSKQASEHPEIHFAEKQDSDLGHCQLWIRVADGLPSRVGIMRKTGMLITTQQAGLQRFPGLRDFAAICRFEGEDGK